MSVKFKYRYIRLKGQIHFFQIVLINSYSKKLSLSAEYFWVRFVLIRKNCPYSFFRFCPYEWRNCPYKHIFFNPNPKNGPNVTPKSEIDPKWPQDLKWTQSDPRPEMDPKWPQDPKWTWNDSQTAKWTQSDPKTQNGPEMNPRPKMDPKWPQDQKWT